MLDFWNDPNRWEGIEDPHKQYFWCGPRKLDVIDVRRTERARPSQTQLALAHLQQSLESSLEAQLQNVAYDQNRNYGAVMHHHSSYSPFDKGIFGNFF